MPCSSLPSSSPLTLPFTAPPFPSPLAPPPAPLQFSNEYSSYVLHNDSLDPILDQQQKEERRQGRAGVTALATGVELGAVRGERGGGEGPEEVRGEQGRGEAGRGHGR